MMKNHPRCFRVVGGGSDGCGGDGGGGGDVGGGGVAVEVVVGVGW